MSYCKNCGHMDPVEKKRLAGLEQAMSAAMIHNGHQDAEITRLLNMFGCAVHQAVGDALDVMLDNGQLDDIIREAVGVANPYYNGIATIKKRAATGTDYYVTTVPSRDADGNRLEWRVGIANDSYNGIGVESTVDFAARKGATLAINAGVYDVDTLEPVGTTIQNGRIIYNKNPQVMIRMEDDPNFNGVGQAPIIKRPVEKYNFLAIMQDGSLRYYHRSTKAGKMIQDGAVDVITVLGRLLVDGEVPTEYYEPDISTPGPSVCKDDTRLEPRQSIGVKPDGTVVVISVDGRKNGEDAGISYADLAQLHADEGCVNAWALDGGGSTSTVLRGVKQNDDIDNFHTDRAVNTFLYIGNKSATGNAPAPGTDLGKVKQLLAAMIMDKKDFYSGYISIRSPEGHKAPGVELYSNGETTRRSKLGIVQAADDEPYLYISFRGGEGEKTNMFRLYDKGAYIQTYHGPTSERPNGPVGLQYFDETLGKPIWRKSVSQWVDADGNDV